MRLRKKLAGRIRAKAGWVSACSVLHPKIWLWLVIKASDQGLLWRDVCACVLKVAHGVGI